MSLKNKEIPFFKPYISEKAIKEVASSIRSGWITTGPKVREFQDKFAEYTNSAYGLALNSCTAALHLGLACFGIKENDEVILPTNTFAASAEVIEYFGAKPVFCDIRFDTMNIDETKIEALITKNTKAIMPVHFAGQACDMDIINKIAKKHKLKIIEDAAHCTPAFYKGKSVGSLGHIGCFSFYANKCITTGEGGMAVTNNKKYIKKMRTLSLHGMSKDAWKRYDNKGSWRYNIVDRGYKYNMSDIMGAIGVDQLANANKIWEKRKRAVKWYNKALKNNKNITLPIELEENESSWHLYVIRLKNIKIRDSVIDKLMDFGIKPSVHFIPLHTQPFYKNKYKYKLNDFPVAYDSFKRSISLPLFPSIKKSDIEYIAEKLEEILG